MPNPNAVVSNVVRMVPGPELTPAEMREGGISVELEGGRRVRLDPKSPRSAGLAQVLEGLRKLRLPVYLEIDPSTSAVTRLLIPLVTRVAAVRAREATAVDVELEQSHARHVVRRDNPDFVELEKRVTDAQRGGEVVVVTENDAHEIIDVRPYKPAPEGPVPPFGGPKGPPPQPPSGLKDALGAIWRLPFWPWWWFRTLSPMEAQNVFNAMGATSCNPLTIPAGCIPFLYPDDGCWARAHEMRRLMLANFALMPRKVWIQGNLLVQTRNNPNCHVAWGWHVAPTVLVRILWWMPWGMRMVIDPSLFSSPVTPATWKGKQGDPNATLTDTDSSDYLWGATDPNYTATNNVLAFYRLQLQNRAVQFGPPPYANCP